MLKRLLDADGYQVKLAESPWTLGSEDQALARMLMEGWTEAAIEQKNIAELFHSFGEMTGEIDYQIAEGDKVATRWFVSLVPSERGKAMGITEVDRVAIINVMRFDETGKIVEFWNHRHDVELPQPPSERRD